ncbi:MAG: ribosome silencing factor [Candidatus Korobacteraceae bacterium]|jgi:ribosome-associated protein
MNKHDIKQQVLIALLAAKSKKAEDITVLQLGKESSAFTDYFLICSGNNPRQVQAIAEEVDDSLSREGLEPNHREGFDQAEWVLLDYVDFVVHIFSRKSRGFYDLERLWKSAKQVDESQLKARTPAKAPAKKATTAKKKIAAKKTAAKRTVKPTAAKRSGTKAAKKAVSRRRTR